MICGVSPQFGINVLFCSRVINAELKALPSQDVPPLTTPTAEVENELQQKVVDELAKITIPIGDHLYNKKLQE